MQSGSESILRRGKRHRNREPGCPKRSCCCPKDVVVVRKEVVVVQKDVVVVQKEVVVRGSVKRNEGSNRPP